MSFAIIGSAEQIRELLCGPAQHNEHCKGYRWHQYVQWDKQRWASVEAELRKMNLERRAREDYAEAAE